MCYILLFILAGWSDLSMVCQWRETSFECALTCDAVCISAWDVFLWLDLDHGTLKSKCQLNVHFTAAATAFEKVCHVICVCQRVQRIQRDNTNDFGTDFLLMFAGSIYTLHFCSLAETGDVGSGHKLTLSPPYFLTSQQQIWLPLLLNKWFYEITVRVWLNDDT